MPDQISHRVPLRLELELEIEIQVSVSSISVTMPAAPAQKQKAAKASKRRTTPFDLLPSDYEPCPCDEDLVDFDALSPGHARKRRG